MPRKPTKQISRAGPYSSPPSSSEDIKPKIRTPGKGIAWSAQELKTLLHFALDRNGRSWAEAVPGRTSNQAVQTWSKSILPYIEKCLEERGEA